MSTSFQTSQSTSTPVVVETPENALIDQISSMASNLAGQMYNWAQGVFAQTSQVTSQAVGNFFNVSQQMQGLSNNLTGQYNNLFAPENAQLVADANSYASPGRMAVDMGQAGATQAQAGDRALHNSEEALRSYGINPADGRYAALDKAAAVQNAANVAGAENTQRNADIATGQRLRSEAVQVGATMPAAISNVNNTAIQANTGASNASLANANTGANLQKLPNEYLSTAMGIKLPPTGQNSQSSSSGTSSSPSRDSGGSRSGGGGGGSPGGGGGPGGGGPAWNPQHSGGPAGAGPGIYPANVPGQGTGNYNDPTGQDYNPLDGIDPSSFSGGDFYQPDPNGASMGVGQAGANAPFNDYNNPFSNPDMGQTFDQGPNNTFTGGQGGQDTEWGNINYDQNANQAGGWGDMGNGSDPFTSDNAGYDPNADWGGGAADNSSYDTNNPDSDFYQGDYQSGGDAEGFAGGGAIPAQMSPSGGGQIDDIPAQGPQGQQLRMNANEFVIPQDVALWKGQEFFQNMIAQSRKKRATASAQPTPMAMR